MAGVVVVEAVEDGVDHGRHVGESVGEQLHLFGLVVVAPLLFVQLALAREHVGGALAARRVRLFACSFEGFRCLAGYVQHGELL